MDQPPAGFAKDKVVGRVTVHYGADTTQVNIIEKRLQLHPQPARRQRERPLGRSCHRRYRL